MIKKTRKSVVTKAIAWAAAFMMVFSPVAQGFATITVYAADGESDGNTDNGDSGSDNSGGDSSGGDNSGSGSSDSGNSGSSSSDSGSSGSSSSDSGNSGSGSSDNGNSGSDNSDGGNSDNSSDSTGDSGNNDGSTYSENSDSDEKSYSYDNSASESARDAIDGENKSLDSLIDGIKSETQNENGEKVKVYDSHVKTNAEKAKESFESAASNLKTAEGEASKGANAAGSILAEANVHMDNADKAINTGNEAAEAAILAAAAAEAEQAAADAANNSATAQAAADRASEDAKEAAEKATEAEKAADTAESEYLAAKGAYEAAVAAAKEAEQTADEAQNLAKADAEAAVAKAQAAKDAADRLFAAMQLAETKAEVARDIAQTLVNEAQKAKTAANTAKDNAQKAYSNAAKAKQDAIIAKDEADKAASEAKDIADGKNTEYTTAQSTVDSLTTQHDEKAAEANKLYQQAWHVQWDYNKDGNIDKLAGYDKTAEDKQQEAEEADKIVAAEREKIQQAETKFNEAVTSIQTKDAEIETIAGQLVTKAQEKAAAEAKVKDIEDNQVKVSTSLEKLTNQVADLQAAWNEANTALQNEKEALDKLIAGNEDGEQNQADIDAATDAADKAMEQAKKDLVDTQNALKTAKAALAKANTIDTKLLNDRISELENSIAEKEAELKRLNDAVDTAKAAYEKICSEEAVKEYKEAVTVFNTKFDNAKPGKGNPGFDFEYNGVKYYIKKGNNGGNATTVDYTVNGETKSCSINYFKENVLGSNITSAKKDYDDAQANLAKSTATEDINRFTEEKEKKAVELSNAIDAIHAAETTYGEALLNANQKLKEAESLLTAKNNEAKGLANDLGDIKLQLDEEKGKLTELTETVTQLNKDEEAAQAAKEAAQTAKAEAQAAKEAAQAALEEAEKKAQEAAQAATEAAETARAEREEYNKIFSKANATMKEAKALERQLAEAETLAAQAKEAAETAKADADELAELAKQADSDLVSKTEALKKAEFVLGATKVAAKLASNSLNATNELLEYREKQLMNASAAKNYVASLASDAAKVLEEAIVVNNQIGALNKYEGTIMEADLNATQERLGELFDLWGSLSQNAIAARSAANLAAEAAVNAQNRADFLRNEENSAQSSDSSSSDSSASVGDIIAALVTQTLTLTEENPIPAAVEQNEVTIDNEGVPLASIEDISSIADISKSSQIVIKDSDPAAILAAVEEVMIDDDITPLASGIADTKVADTKVAETSTDNNELVDINEEPTPLSYSTDEKSKNSAVMAGIVAAAGALAVGYGVSKRRKKENADS